MFSHNKYIICVCMYYAGMCFRLTLGVFKVCNIHSVSILLNFEKGKVVQKRRYMKKSFQVF